MRYYKDPKSTLAWTAYHVCDKLFYAKYEAGKITMNEYSSLVNLCIARRTAHIAKHRKWYEIRLRWKDWVFLRQMHKLKEVLEPKRKNNIPSLIEGGIVKGNPISIV